MHRILAVTLLLCFSTVAISQDPPPRDTLSSKLFPMAIGDRWVYAYEEQEVTFEVLRKEAIGDVAVHVVRRTIGKEPVEFKVSVEEDGVYIHQDGDKKFAPPLRQFAFFARTGDTWNWKGTASDKPEAQKFEHLGFRKVSVPAGEYSAVAVQQTNPATAEFSTFWLVKEIGVVQVSGKTEVAAGEARVTFEWKLKKYEPKSK